MTWYYRVLVAINAAAPFLAPTQTANLALLVSAIPKKRTLCLSELALSLRLPALYVRSSQGICELSFRHDRAACPSPTL